MKVRDVVLQDELAQVVDARTWTFPINLVDPVTEIKVWMYAQNHATGPNTAGPIPYVIDEVAVIDGSEVIASLNGPEAVALYAFDHARMPMHWEDQAGGAEQFWCVPITFGRHLWDPSYVFDPRRFRNPQIRISFNLAAVAPVGANGYASGSARISVWAKVIEDGATPRGYLMAKELKEFASLAAGQDVTYLPTDYNIRKILVRAYKAGGRMDAAITRLKLSQDEDRWIPWDLEASDFLYLMRDWFSEVGLDLGKVASDAATLEHYGGARAYVGAVAGQTDEIVGLSAALANTVTAYLITHAGAAVTNGKLRLNVRTRTPFDCYCYPFGDQDDPATWLDVSGMGNLRLLLTQGATGYTEQIVVQQVHPY